MHLIYHYKTIFYILSIGLNVFPMINRNKHMKNYCFYFYYRAYGEDGREIFDPIRNDEIVPIITDRLGFTIEDMGTFREKVTDKGLVNRSAVYRETKKYFKDYH